jgi:hypothetical protein
MDTLSRDLFPKTIPIVLSVVMTVSNTVRAETPPPPAAPAVATSYDRAAPADGWQRGFEVGSLVATVLTLGCGRSLLARKDGAPDSDYRISYDTHRALHAAFGATALSLNFLAAWQQVEINRQREKFEFRHWAHNGLFWSSAGTLTASAALGIIGTQTGSRDVDITMRATGWVSLGLLVFDMVLFGGHDNSVLFTSHKIAF